MINANVKWTIFTPELIARSKRMARGSLHKIGAYVRRRARQLIRRRKRPSQPGQPPSSPTGFLKNTIVFAVSPEEQAVYIGPLWTKTEVTGLTVPGRLEFGGPIPARPNTYWKKKPALGGKGPIALKPRRGKSTVRIKSRRGTFHVVMTTLKSQRQLDDSLRIWETVFGPALLPATTMLPRPYMSKALREELLSGKLLGTFKGAFNTA